MLAIQWNICLVPVNAPISSNQRTKAALGREGKKEQKKRRTKPNRTERRVEWLSCTHATFFSFVTYVSQIVMSFLLALFYDLEMNDIYLCVNYTTASHFMQRWVESAWHLCRFVMPILVTPFAEMVIFFLSSVAVVFARFFVWLKRDDVVIWDPRWMSAKERLIAWQRILWQPFWNGSSAPSNDERDFERSEIDPMTGRHLTHLEFRI